MSSKKAIIIGAGPAGLTTAFEMLERTDIHPIILEASEQIGGISQTINYKGNRIDIGGHRFFSKSDRVMNWWLDRLPLEALDGDKATIMYQRKQREVEGSESGPNPDEVDEVMLLRERTSRIYFLRRFFAYPISLSYSTLRNLGVARTIRIGFSYMRSVVFPIRNESNLEEFFINRFGKELYLTFFKSYTEKVWGIPCDKISAEWGAQRIKGLSITSAILHILKQAVPAKKDISQKDTETSLIEQFLYPKHGPGQMWETVADTVRAQGGEIHMGHAVERVESEDGAIRAVIARDNATGEMKRFEGDYIISTMAVQDLVNAMGASVPEDVKRVSDGLVYRDFITVGLLVKKLKIHSPARPNDLVSDNWIYIQEPDVKLGRLQIFNNWSPYMVSDPNTVWLGLEYFCDEGDELWCMDEEAFGTFAADELAAIDIIDSEDVLDRVVIRVKKTYPAYFGSYDEFGVIRSYVDSFANLFLIGRNGMHRYNNQDHSMLTAMVAVDNISAGVTSKDNIWDVNTETEYHEEK